MVEQLEAGMLGALGCESSGAGAQSIFREMGEEARESVGGSASPGRQVAIREDAPLDIRFVIPGEPKGKGRHRSRIAKMGDGRQFIANYAPKGTVEYENLVRIAASAAMSGRAPTGGPVLVEIVATCSVPKSWSNKRRGMALTGEILPTGKPDLDNSLKAILDGMNKIVFADDAQTCRVGMSKQYGETPGVFVRVVELHARPSR